jgi:SAM-dependent methyltransferase
MFGKSAQFYDALYAGKDYAQAATRLQTLIRERLPHATTLLDVGCGTGRHLECLRGQYRSVEGLDLNPGLLAIARSRLPGVALHCGDMASFDLGKKFDVVICLFSAIAYVESAERMRQSIAAMSRHLEPNGLLIVEPWFSPESYWTGTITANFVDQPDLKIAWMYTSQREKDVSVLDISYLVGTPSEVSTFREMHRMGLFSNREYEGAFAAAGLRVEHDPVGLFGRGLFIGQGPTR